MPGFLLILPCILFLNACGQDNTPETTSEGSGILISAKLVKENRENPGESIFAVEVADTGEGNLVGEGLAKDLEGSHPGEIIDVTIAQRSGKGAYIKAVKSRHYVQKPDSRPFHHH